MQLEKSTKNEIPAYPFLRDLDQIYLVQTESRQNSK